MTKALAIQQAVVQQGSSLIDNKTIISSGAFRHAFVATGAHLSLFSHPLCLTRLGIFLTDALAVSQKYLAIGLSFLIFTLRFTQNQSLAIHL